MKPFFLLIAFCLGLSSLSLHAEIYAGSGPDQACGGTTLKVEKKKYKIIFMEYVVFTSQKTIVEQLQLNKQRTWDITVRVYSINWWQDKPLTADKIISTHYFKNTEIEKGKKTSQAIGFRDLDWKAEPNRLIKYFTDNQPTFEKKADESL